VNDIALTNTPEFTVTELSGALKRKIEDEFGHVRVRGEISGYRGPHSSGHAYFSLKDQSAKIDAVVWKGVFGRMRVRPEEGMEVVATGKLTTFPGSSKYQIVIESMELAGAGALMALLEARRKKLAAEGLFAEERKQLLPYLPRVIGVVTSPTGAVIRDILHRISDRMPCHVLIWPVRVQGETCAAEVSAAIAGFNALAPDGRIPRPDVLIVARGGGSLEDLSGFSEENVVRAAAASLIPLISAVGHETDWTLIDHAADVRAPTPTAAAEMAVPVRSELLSTINDLGGRLYGSLMRAQERRARDFRNLVRALPAADMVLAGPRQRLDLLSVKLDGGLPKRLNAHRLRLAGLGNKLASQSPHSRLARSQGMLQALAERLRAAPVRLAERRQQRLEATAKALKAALGKRVAIAGERQKAARERLDRVSLRLHPAILAQINRRRDALGQLDKMRQSLGYKQVLARGFALVRDEAGRPLRAAEVARLQSRLNIEFADGVVGAVAVDAPAPFSGPLRAKKPDTGGGQGSLF